MLRLVFPVVCAFLDAIAHVQGLGITVLAGDVYIEYIGAIYTDSSCSNIEAETVQNIQAIKWTLSKLNEIDYIPNVNIGLRVSQTCRKQGEAERLALQLSAEMLNDTEARTVGIIGADYSSESESISQLISSLPEEYRLLQLAYSSTSSSLSNKDIYKNFFRTIQPDDIQVEVMVEYIEALNWTYMAIIYDEDAYGRGGKDQLLARMKGRDICFPTLISVDTSYQKISKLETDIEEKIIGRDIPISGILVFGSSVLADLVLTVTENVIEKNPNASRPVFIFSEAGAYIQGHHTNISKGAFLLSPPRRSISNFQQEWKTIFTDIVVLYQESNSNAWIRDVYKAKFNCTLAESVDQHTCSEISSSEFDELIPESVYNQYAIQATMVIAKIVQNVYLRKCPSKDEICGKFIDKHDTPRGEFIKELTEISAVDFDDFGSFRIDAFQNPDLTVSFGNSSEATLPENIPVYQVYSHQKCSVGPSSSCLVEVANYKRSKELLVDFEKIKDYGVNGEELLWPNIRMAQCPDGSFCSKCVDMRVEDSILFIPGDMYIVGIVPVHNKGSTPLQCGDIKKGGLDVVETIRFAVEEAITKPNANIGIIIIDSCNDPQIIQEKILTLHRLGVYINGEYIYVSDKILGYIGGWSSDMSKAVAEITSRLEYPQISYASTASVLSKRSLYPYLLRIPSSDEKQAETLLKIVDELKGNYIQILHSDSAYGEGGRDTLIGLINSSFEICVAQVLPISRNSDKGDVLANLRKFPQAKIVILFLGSFEIEYMIDSFNSLKKNEFLFISSEGWGIRIDVDRYPNMVGSITLTSQLPINQKLKDHMKNLRPDNSNVDPWIRPYLEHEFDCYFEWSYNKSTNKQCHGEISLDVFTTDFTLDVWTPFAERAVTALLSGTEAVLRNKCNENTRVICDHYRNSTQQVYEAIKQFKLKRDNGNDERVFNNNGDGTAGYQVYVVALDQGGQYKQIGQSSLGVGNELVVVTFQTSTFNSVRREAVNSSCTGNIEKCNQCFPSPIDPTCTDLQVGVIVVIVLLGIVCCVLAGILLCICNRLGCFIIIENGRPKVSDTYLTPVCGTERNAQMADGRESPIHEGNYDSIQNSGVGSYNRSQAPSYFDRPPTTDGSTSSSEKTTSGGSGAAGRQNSRTAGNIQGAMTGFDNAAFENKLVGESGREQISVWGSRQPSRSEHGYSKQDDGYLISEKNPDAHQFIKPMSGPAPPPRLAAVAYQADGSYITASSVSEAKISGGSVASTQTDQV